MTLLNVSLTNSTRCPNAGNFARAFRQTTSDGELGDFITNYILRGGEARGLMNTIRHNMTNYDAILDNYRDNHSGRMDYRSRDIFHDEVNAQIVRRIRSYAVSIINGQTDRIARLERENTNLLRVRAQREALQSGMNSLLEIMTDPSLTTEERDELLTNLALEHCA